jgi:hypothetical protein
VGLLDAENFARFYLYKAAPLDDAINLLEARLQPVETAGIIVQNLAGNASSIFYAGPTQVAFNLRRRANVGRVN